MSGPARIVAKAGKATIEIDQAAVMAQVDRILGGSLSTFVNAARRQMDPVVKDATTDRTMWPRRTGRSQAGTHVVERLSTDAVEVVALNEVPYTYKVRFSVVTRATMNREARQVAARTWSNLAPHLAGATSVAQQKLLTRKFIKEASGGLIGGWYSRATPSARAIYDRWLSGLRWRHGTGAPNETVAGRSVWSERMRKPLKRREDALISESREALTKLSED